MTVMYKKHLRSLHYLYYKNLMSYYTLFLPTCMYTSYCLPCLAPSLVAKCVSRTDRVGLPAVVYS